MEVLTDIFDRYWWNSAFKQLKALVATGIAETEIARVYEIRLIWASYQEFGEYVTVSGSRGIYAFNLPWQVCWQLLRLYASYPSSEEIEVSLVKLYEKWTNNRLLQRTHPSFYRLVKPRLETNPAGSIHDSIEDQA